MTPKSTKSDLIGPKYRHLKIEQPQGWFFEIKKIYANDSSFERARRAESNDIKINVIGQDLTKLWHYLDLPESTIYVISLSNQVGSRRFWCHSTQLDELFRMSYHLYKFQSLWFFAPVVLGSVFRSNQVGFGWFWCHSTQLDGFYNCCSDWPFLHIFRKKLTGRGGLNKYRTKLWPFILSPCIGTS